MTLRNARRNDREGVLSIYLTTRSCGLLLIIVFQFVLWTLGLAEYLTKTVFGLSR